MKIHRLLQVWLLLCLLGCTATPSTPAATPETTSNTPLTPAPGDFSDAEAVGRAFLDAWSKDDTARMYELLAPSLRAGLALDPFAQAYRAAQATATVLQVRTLPHQLGLENTRAWIDFTVIWQTALFGELQAENRLALIKEGDAWWVDWRREAIWPDLAGGNKFAVEYQVPPRANIYDRHQAALAALSTIVTVGVVPERIENEATLLANLSIALNLSQESIQAKYAGQPASWFIAIADITGEQSLAYDTLLRTPGVERRERAGRFYPENGAGAHVVGWVSAIPAEQLESYRQQGYRDDALVGISGLEAYAESILAGKNGGRLYLVDANDAYVRGVAERRPERGRAVTATLDRTLQAQAEAILKDFSGAIVALDVNTGAVRVMASAPTFDNNIFVRPTDSGERQALLNDSRRPLLNRATQGTYPSASVFKIVTLSAALETGLFNVNSAFNCPGYWDVFGEANRKTCWLATGHGPITLFEGLVQSCDVVFYEVGMALDHKDPALLPTYGAAFGLGQRTGIVEIPEVAGLMPTPQWKFDTYLEPWTAGDTVNLAIGQGFLLVTPLQVAEMLAAIANGGTLYQPYVIERLEASSSQPEQQTQPLARGRLPISEATLATLREGLLQVTTAANGTATHRFAGLNVSVAGKTGTAEAPGPGSEPHAWFAGYFPADKPEIAMAVLVENIGEGSSYAAPIFRQMVEAYYGWPLTPLPVISAPTGD